MNNCGVGFADILNFTHSCQQLLGNSDEIGSNSKSIRASGYIHYSLFIIHYSFAKKNRPMGGFS